MRFVLILFLIVLAGCKKTYEDCILENMKGVTSNFAALQIQESCEIKYRSEKKKTAEAPPAEAAPPEAPPPGLFPSDVESTEEFND